MDIYYRREETRVGGDFRQYPERFRVERARFIVAIPFITYLSSPSHMSEVNAAHRVVVRGGRYHQEGK
jgi:hypothetical protein